MMQRLKLINPMAAVAGLVLCACGALSAGPEPTGTPQPAPTFEEATAELAEIMPTAAAPTATIVETVAATAVPENTDPAGCPLNVAGVQFYEEEMGFCVQVPEGFTVHHGMDDDRATITFYHRSEWPPSDSWPALIIQVSEAQGKTAAEVAEAAVSDGYSLLSETQTVSLLVGGEEGVMLDPLSGQDLNRKVFVVHGGTAYEMRFVPSSFGSSDPTDERYANMKLLYEAIIGSFTFAR